METLDRVTKNLFPKGRMHETVKVAVVGAQHTEYELRTVRKLVTADFAGKSKLLLTGVLDLVVQQQPLTYARTWVWTDPDRLRGKVDPTPLTAAQNDLEIWDYKGTRASIPYKSDYVRQLLTYAALYRERTGVLPKRCVLFFVNEQDAIEQLLAVQIDSDIVNRALEWTITEVKRLRETVLQFENSPCSVEGGSVDLKASPAGKRTDAELAAQCTACAFRFDCGEYLGYLGKPDHPDVRVTNVFKN
jgi:hypothetical protein